MRGRWTVVRVALFAGAIVATAAPVSAGPKAEKKESGITAGASTPGGGSAQPRAGRSGSSIKCSYKAISDIELYDVDGSIVSLPQGSNAYSRICVDSTGREVSNRTVVVPRPSPPQLARDALSYEPLPTPQPVTSPPNGKTYVNFETWLAVDDWSRVEATASVPGLTTTVTAEPAEAIWKMGDGETVVCKGPGKPYDLTLHEDAQDTDCSYTYRRSSAGVGPDNTYPASVTVTYRVTWAASDGSQGDLGLLPVTTNFAMRVREVQVINVYPRDP